MVVTDDGNIRVVIFGYPVNVALLIAVIVDGSVKFVITKFKLVICVDVKPIAVNCACV